MAEDIVLFGITGIYSMLILSLSLSFLVGIRVGQVMKRVDIVENRVNSIEALLKEKK